MYWHLPVDNGEGDPKRRWHWKFCWFPHTFNHPDGSTTTYWLEYIAQRRRYFNENKPDEYMTPHWTYYWEYAQSDEIKMGDIRIGT